MSAFGKAPKNSPRQAHGPPGEALRLDDDDVRPVHLEVVPCEALPPADGTGERLGPGGLDCRRQDRVKPRAVRIFMPSLFPVAS